MKNLLILLSAVILSACGHKHQVSIDPAFQPYVDQFVAHSNQEGRSVSIDDLIIEFDSSIGGNVIGLCASGGDDTPKITINTTAWNNSLRSASYREQLIFHEMGHCVLGRGHNDQTVQAADISYYKLPVSVMNPYHIGYNYEKNYHSYIRELFTGVYASNLYAMNSSQFDGSYYGTIASLASLASSDLDKALNQEDEMVNRQLYATKEVEIVNEQGVKEVHTECAFGH